MSTPSDPPELRIGDADRDAAVEALGEHYLVGRLTKQEYDERAARAWAARTASQLRPLFADLPRQGTGPGGAADAHRATSVRPSGWPSGQPSGRPPGRSEWPSPAAAWSFARVHPLIAVLVVVLLVGHWWVVLPMVLVWMHWSRSARDGRAGWQHGQLADPWRHPGLRGSSER